jgi:hypothetical protein
MFIASAKSQLSRGSPSSFEDGLFCRGTEQRVKGLRVRFALKTVSHKRLASFDHNVHVEQANAAFQEPHDPRFNAGDITGRRRRGRLVGRTCRAGTLHGTALLTQSGRHRSVRLDARELDQLAPFLCILSDDPAEIGRRSSTSIATRTDRLAQYREAGGTWTVSAKAHLSGAA